MRDNHTLTTKYSDAMDKTIPWNEYPRPSLRRDSFFCLNGSWDFTIGDKEPESYTEKILVPFPPESALSGVEKGHKDGEKLYYRRSFILPEGFVKDKIILHFGAADQICEVYVNGKLIGNHEGGYIPFSFDISDVYKDGENEIRLICTDDLSKLYPYGKQTKKRGGMWYTPVSGIWQTVWIESLPKAPIHKLKIKQSINKIEIDVLTDAKEKKLTILETNETFVFNTQTFVYTNDTPLLWTPETPNIYNFVIETDTDRVEGYFAFRDISTKTSGGVSKICLNGKPYLFNGLLDQGYYPDGIFLPATSEAYKDDILTAKRLGFNTLRKHIKIEPEIFYYLCDTLGIVVFQDMINNSDYSFIRDTALPTLFMKKLSDKKMHRNEKSREIFISEMEQTLLHLYNHPSVLYYTIFNEGWGQFSADYVFSVAKGIDGTRIFDATSGWFWQKDSDVLSYHIYFKKLKVSVSDKIPTVISEFGGYSHRCEGHLFGNGNYGYRNIDDRVDFENAVALLYENEVLPLVKKGVSAFIYTQISDIEDETNGFLTYDRKVLKVNPDKIFGVMQKLYTEFHSMEEL